ncbi:MAG: hypothetical protein GEV06_08580 [Luteitalea sp.]|nr:hypothetical protein [Luteitalea sp.]
MTPDDGISADAGRAQRAGSTLILLLVVAAGIHGARILSAPPVLIVNDQSRWSTIRALVDTGTYSIGGRFGRRYDGTHRDVGIVSEPGWWTVDQVLNPTTGRFYSSKPTLLPTLLAGEYWLLKNTLGWEITTDRTKVARTILLTINWLPFVWSLWLLARVLERHAQTAWARSLVMSAACFGTFVSTFLISLNNHTVAAAGVMFTLYHLLRIQLENRQENWRFAAVGLFAGWTACNELPAASFAAGALLWLSTTSWRRTLSRAVPYAALPVIAYLATQYVAFGDIVPTYGRADWYHYAGAYWNHPVGIDAVHEPKRVYALNLLVGHTGILSLTPLFLVGWLGMLRWIVRPDGDDVQRRGKRWLGGLTLAVTVVVFLFYVVRTHNYGGITSAPRWFFWLGPLWLVTMMGELDRWASSRWGRRVATLLLAVSVASASVTLANPWQASWLLSLLRDLRLVNY